MSTQIECFAQKDAKDKLKFIQYKCGCGNFEEQEVINGDYSLKKFDIYTAIKDETFPVRYICKKCHVEQKFIKNSATPLTP